MALFALRRFFLTLETVVASGAVKALFLASNMVVSTSSALGHSSGTFGAVVTLGADVACSAIYWRRRGRFSCAVVARSAFASASADAEGGRLAEVSCSAVLAGTV